MASISRHKKRTGRESFLTCCRDEFVYDAILDNYNVSLDIVSGWREEEPASPQPEPADSSVSFGGT